MDADIGTEKTAIRKTMIRNFVTDGFRIGTKVNRGVQKTKTLFVHLSYGILTKILTDKRNSYVFLKRNTEIQLRMNGNVTLEIGHYTGCEYHNVSSRSCVCW